LRNKSDDLDRKSILTNLAKPNVFNQQDQIIEIMNEAELFYFF